MQGEVGIDFTTFAQEWIAAWNARDLELILAHYADEVELSSPFVLKTTRQPAGLIRANQPCVATSLSD
jgi:ketosteroid isomerase-like protein